jgi:cytochrome c biogenesis protein CcdA
VFRTIFFSYLTDTSVNKQKEYVIALIDGCVNFFSECSVISVALYAYIKINTVVHAAHACMSRNNIYFIKRTMAMHACQNRDLYLTVHDIGPSI